MSVRPPPEGRRERLPWLSLGQLGVVLLLVSISVLFVAASVAVLITHAQAPAWRASEQHGLPWSTALSTALLALVSAQLQLGLVAIRSNRFTTCLTRLRQGSYAAAGFLFVQAWNARQLFALQAQSSNRALFLFSYGLLVGLHALHVLGGFVPLFLVQNKVARRDYSSSRHAGLTFCVQYWHYLGVIWLGLLATLAWVA
ncbi:MAG TPA: cytochrome c oxidase subunit 3 [Polyangiaceae bacterium]|jgi:cytochrome c oxidase subunit 3|nr:cytochrome c oxidase subunit 3 [Polyangiaceae bacterium]